MIGVDILEISRMESILNRSKDIFLKRVFSENELQIAQTMENPIAYFASGFAAKEAVFKALTLYWEQGVELTEIEISRSPSGEPFIELSGITAKIALEKGFSHLYLSLSYETNLVIAMVYGVKDFASLMDQ